MDDLISRQKAIDAIKNQTSLTYEEIFNRCLVSIKDENGWWSSDRKSYTVIPTKYHKGYMKALEDVEKEIRSRFGFAERDGAIIDHIFGFDKREEE